MPQYAVSFGNRLRAFVFDTDRHPFLKIERIDGGTNDFSLKSLFSDSNGIFNPSGAGSPGAGDVTGPGSSTDEAIARFDGAGGKTLQNSAVTLDNSGNLSGITTAAIASYRLIAHGSATLAAGTIAVALAAIATGALVQVTRSSTSSGYGHLYVTVSNGVGFTVTSTDVADDGTLYYQVWNTA